MRDVTIFFLSLQGNKLYNNINVLKNCVKVIIKYKLYQLYIK